MLAALVCIGRAFFSFGVPKQKSLVGPLLSVLASVHVKRSNADQKVKGIGVSD